MDRRLVIIKNHRETRVRFYRRGDTHEKFYCPTYSSLDRLEKLIESDLMRYKWAILLQGSTTFAFTEK